MGAVGLSWLAATHPLLTAAIVVVLVVIATFIIWKLFGFFRRIFTRIRGPGPAPGPAP